MQLLNEHHAFTGIQRDMEASKQPPSFMYNAKNIRLTSREGDTLCAITNEKGTLATNITISGSYLGHCLINNYLVVFSTQTSTTWVTEQYPDHIYRINLDTEELVELYKGHLNFFKDFPITCIGSYENADIQKVYWIDKRNQPRMINIVGNIPENVDTQFDFVRELQLNETITIQKQFGSGSFPPGVLQYAFTYYTKHGQESSIFYTSPLLYTSHADRGEAPDEKVANIFKITVEHFDTNFDFLRIYSILRTSINGTPIVKRVQDINVKDFIGVPSDSTSTLVRSHTRPEIFINGELVDFSSIVTNVNIRLFGRTEWYGIGIKVKYPNLYLKTSDGYISWGSNSVNASWLFISKTSIRIDGVDGWYICSTLSAHNTDGEDADYNLISVSLTAHEGNLNQLTFVDTGYEGDSIDPTELLYKGGESIIAGTLEQKDNTLFFGNIRLERPVIRDDVANAITISQSTRTFYPAPSSVYRGDYAYANQLTSYANNTHTKSVSCGGFKRGDYYRCGVQFQYKDGKWSDPIFINDIRITNSPSLAESGTVSVTVPALTGTISSAMSSTLVSKGYKKARAVVVFPQLQDRVVLCQGVLCPTLCTDEHRTNKDLYAQSSWFFRPKYGSNVTTQVRSNGTAIPPSSNGLTYMLDTIVGGGSAASSPALLRQVEVQGNFNKSRLEGGNYVFQNQFAVCDGVTTFHSPDIEFDDDLRTFDFEDVSYRGAGYASCVRTFSNINIQTETPTFNVQGGGFIQKGFVENGAYGIISGLFYDDFLIDDLPDQKFQDLPNEKSPYKWMVYLWHRNGSLNNDINRPAEGGVRTAMLKKKVISNLRYTTSSLADSTSYDNGNNTTSMSSTPKIFDSDQLGIVKLGSNIYMGNIDTLLVPDDVGAYYFAFDGVNGTTPAYDVESPTAFNSTSWWRTAAERKLQYWSNNSWHEVNVAGTGDYFKQVIQQKEGVRMKYKSTAHLVTTIGYNAVLTASSIGVNDTVFPIVEIGRFNSNAERKDYRGTMFGGKNADALKANLWIPCGEPVPLGNGTEGSTVYQYEYGDTYYQRWDCLKTYPFTLEDQNQVIEIGSFVLETRINADGRYDKNRGQQNNVNVHETNFNRYNPVYSQVNNFFSYRILDDSYYNINTFPNQIAWSKEKQAGADVDLWTNVTLASTYDLDGSNGEIVSLNKWKDQLYCFQTNGISIILFNSRVQIPTSDGMPIEIGNNYKVDGCRYITSGIGCKGRTLIKGTPSGLYFIDSIGGHLHHIAEGIQDVTTNHCMSSWFKNNSSLIKRLAYDNINHDLYLVMETQSLCFSEILSQFTSFMDYDDIFLIETCNNKIFTLHDKRLFKMFEGEYNDFFAVGDIHHYKPWEFTFTSNGVESSAQDFDKIFSNIDYRADVFNPSDAYLPEASLDYIRVVNEYQDTGIVPLTRLKSVTNPKSYHHNGTNLQKKFRIWKIQIPRQQNSLNRIRNPWCRITLGCNGENNQKAILHDLNVQYYI